jgi:hypothetical protein
VPLFLLTALLLALPPLSDVEHPVVISTRAHAYRHKDHLDVTVENRADKPLRVRPGLAIDRSVGDGTWESVFTLRIASRCPDGDAREKPMGTACITLPPRSETALPTWDFYTAGADQCPPRPPGLRAFRGAYRLTVTPCDPETASFKPAIRYITWE